MVKREHVAWALLMVSFALLATVTALLGGDIRAFLHGRTRVMRMAEARQLTQAGKAEAADRIYAELAEDYPAREDVLLEYAQHLDGLGRNREAEDMYRKAASQGRQRHASVRRYALFLDRQGRRPEAIALYERYVTDHPDDLSARLDLGLRLAAEGEFERGEPHLLAAAGNPGLRFGAERALAEAYAARAMKHKEIDTWLRVVAMDASPEKQVYWQDIAEAYGALDDVPKAIDAWQRYLEHFPNSLTGARKLAQAYERAGNEEGRRRAALLIRSLTPTRPIRRNISPRVVVEGVDPASDPSSPMLDVYFRFHGTLLRPDQCAVRFWLVQDAAADDGPAIPVTSQPARIGPAPLWRGDSMRQRFALALPEDLAPGTYMLEIGLGTDNAPRIPLCPLDATPGQGKGQAP